MSNLPKIETLRRLLSYNPKTGKLIWLPRTALDCPKDGGRRWNGRYAGKEAFRISPNGYRQGMIKRKMVRAHRVAWAIHHGEWPEADIDHINGVRSDNRLVNLRSVPRKVNAQNQKVRINSKSGVLGVSRYRNKWRAYISVEGKPIHLGIFSNKNDAISARQEAQLAHGYHPNHGRAS